MYEYVGHFHVHSTDSDGAKSKEEVIQLANRIGLDLVCFMDHAECTDLALEFEGWHGRTMALVGAEVNERFNHYLAMRISTRLREDTYNPQNVIDQVRDQGGLGFIAHPFEHACPLSDTKLAYTWNNWDVSGYTGICLWNFMSAWKGKAQGLLSGFYYYARPCDASAGGPDDKTLQTWDRACQERRVVGIGGSDAHEHRFRLGPLGKVRIFPYEFLLRTVNTHLLVTHKFSGDFELDRERAYGALEEGRCFVANDYLASSRGFRFYALLGGREIPMGEEVPWQEGIRLLVSCPRRALIVVRKDGRVWSVCAGFNWFQEIQEAAVYRAEVFLPGRLGGKRAWIFSNPIYVRSR